MVRRGKFLLIAGLLLHMTPVVGAGQDRTYTVTWLGIPVVDIGVSQAEGDFGAWVTYTAKTRAWFDAFYPLDNWYQVQFPSRDSKLGGYRKRILEKGNADSLSVLYDLESGEATYSNGIVREWHKGDHNLFSALIWVERRPWRSGEQQTISVEVEGVTWEVQADCYDVASLDGEPSDCLVEVTFIKVIRGEPVQSSTDMLTHLLPGEGHKLRLGLDSKRLQIRWVELGRVPFVIRARLNEERSLE